AKDIALNREMYHKLEEGESTLKEELKRENNYWHLPVEERYPKEYKEQYDNRPYSIVRILRDEQEKETLLILARQERDPPPKERFFYYVRYTENSKTP